MKTTLGIMIKQANNALARDLDRFAKTLGLTGMQLNVINYITDHETTRDVFQRDIEHEFNIRKATASSLISKMEAKDLLIRVPSKQDARYKRLLLTTNARQLATQIEIFIQASEQRMAALLPTTFATTYHALEQISTAFDTPTTPQKSTK